METEEEFYGAISISNRRHAKVKNLTNVPVICRYIVFTKDGEDWVQQSVELTDLAQAKKYAKDHTIRRKISSIVCQIIEENNGI